MHRAGEYWRWGLGLVLAALVAYFTAIGAVNQRVAVVDTREQSHFDEILRRLDRIDRKLDR